MNKHLFVSATKGNGEDTAFKRWTSLVNLNGVENMNLNNLSTIQKDYHNYIMK